MNNILKTLVGALLSKTVWGVIITTLGSSEIGKIIIESTGLTPESGSIFAQHCVEAFGALLAIYGRITAKGSLAEKIKSK